MQTHEEVAREAMGNVAGPMRRIFGGDVMARELLDALDVLVEQEVEQLTDLIRERDAEVRADERAKVLAGFTEESRSLDDGYAGQIGTEGGRMVFRAPTRMRRLVGPWGPTP